MHGTLNITFLHKRSNHLTQKMRFLSAYNHPINIYNLLVNRFCLRALSKFSYLPLESDWSIAQPTLRCVHHTPRNSAADVPRHCG